MSLQFKWTKNSQGPIEIEISGVEQKDLARTLLFLQLMQDFLISKMPQEDDIDKASTKKAAPLQKNNLVSITISNPEGALSQHETIMKQAFEEIVAYPVKMKEGEEQKADLYQKLEEYFEIKQPEQGPDSKYDVLYEDYVAPAPGKQEVEQTQHTTPPPPAAPPPSLVARLDQATKKIIVNLASASQKFGISINDARAYFTDSNLLLNFNTMLASDITSKNPDLELDYIGEDQEPKSALKSINALTAEQVKTALAELNAPKSAPTEQDNLLNQHLEKNQVVKVETSKTPTNEETTQNLATSAAGNEAENTTEQPIASITQGSMGENKITIDLKKAAERLKCNVSQARLFFSQNYARNLNDSSESVTRDKKHTTIDLLFDASTLDLETTLNEINALTQENYQEYILPELDEVKEDAVKNDAFKGDDGPTTEKMEKHKDPPAAQSKNRNDPSTLAGNPTDAAPHQPHMSVVAAISSSVPNSNQGLGNGNPTLTRGDSWKNPLLNAHEHAAEHKLANATKSYFDALAKTEEGKGLKTELYKGELTVKQNADTILHMAPPDKSGNVKTEHNGSNMAWSGVFEGMIVTKHTTCAFTLSDANPETNKESAEGFVNTLNTMLNDNTKSATLKEIVFTFQDDNTKHLVTQALQKHGETATLALFGLEKVGETVQPTSADTHTDAQKHNTAQISKTALAAPAEAAGRQKQESNALAHAEAAYALKDDLFGQDKHDKRGPHG